MNFVVAVVSALLLAQLFLWVGSHCAERADSTGCH